MKNNNDHWFFDLLKIFYDKDQIGPGLSWEDFKKSGEGKKILNKQNKNNEDYIKNIFLDVSESFPKINGKSIEASPEKLEEDSKRYLKTKMYERYIGYLELQSANKSSQESKELAWFAIGISIILGILSLSTSIINTCYSQKQLKITQKQIDARIKLSEDIEEKINNIENSNRIIVEEIKKQSKR